MPTDQGQDNTYDVVVTVSDGAQLADVPVTVTVTDDNEPFELEGDTAFDYDENGTRRVGVFSVVDDPENGPIVWERSGTDRSGRHGLEIAVPTSIQVLGRQARTGRGRGRLRNPRRHRCGTHRWP